jgi:hypothetical protein
MAEPIRRVAPPARRRPLHAARAQSRLRSIPWTGDETGAAHLPQARTTPAEPAQPPSPASPAAPRPAAAVAPGSRPPAPEPDTQTRPWTRAFQPVAEKKLRTFLLAALGLHGAALGLPFLLPSALPAPSPSDIVLAAAVLIAGSAVLALGALGRRAG